VVVQFGVPEKKSITGVSAGRFGNAVLRFGDIPRAAALLVTACTPRAPGGKDKSRLRLTLALQIRRSSLHQPNHPVDLTGPTMVGISVPRTSTPAPLEWICSF
jgi:hypothetical protein